MRGITSQSSDYTFVSYFFVILLFGLLILSSAGVAVGLDRFGDPYFFIKRQLLFGFLPGVILFLVASKINYQYWKRLSLFIFIAGLLLLVLPFISGIGSTYNTGARSWINLFGFSFQPAEAAKLATIVYFAALLSTLGKQIEHFTHGFLFALGIGLLPVILIALQPDIGTTFILFSIVISMLFVARAKWSHMGLVAVVAIIGFIIMITAASYRVDRFMTFLHPELDPQGQGYHINQAYLAIGSGGWFGLGLGHSRQKFQYLPEVHADSIFAIAAEELGFFIIFGLIVLMVFFLTRGFFIASNSKDEFGRLLVSGIMIWFVVQTLLNIGAMVGLVPLTGVPLPFMSHGGSALMIGMLAIGIVVNVSKKSSI